MIVLGDISGIQSYVFDVAETGGGQAQRLRARSFFVQLMAETAALQTLRALGWPADSKHFLLSGAGKFLLQGGNAPSIAERLIAEQRAINEWLREKTRAELRLTLAWDASESEVIAYRTAQRNLQRAKLQPWAPAHRDKWDVARLIFEPLSPPCSLCGHALGQEIALDRKIEPFQLICRACATSQQLGQRLPCAHWLVIRNSPEPKGLEMFGLGVEILDGRQSVKVDDQIVKIANLRDEAIPPSACPPERFLIRRLMAHVPTTVDDRPLDFTEIARLAQGDHLLGVLKADADSLGVQFEGLLNKHGLGSVKVLSERLDAFFAGRLRQELATGGNDSWKCIYTIFAGGDDLVMVGPWNVMFDFAGQMREWFAEEFRGHQITLSAGLALVKSKRPIKGAVAEAEKLLDEAKTYVVPGESLPKDQFSAFGQVWKWRHHSTIISTARQIAAWVNSGAMERGWLHTLLELTEARHGSRLDPMATARLSYHVDRNYRDTNVRRWGSRLVECFDDSSDIHVRYLPAILRCALTSTRSPAEEE